jgi:hypothetical protein
MKWDGMEWEGMKWDGMEWEGMEWEGEALPSRKLQLMILTENRWFSGEGKEEGITRRA